MINKYMKTGKIELLKAQGFKLVEKGGKKFIYAPLDDTRLFHAEATGRVYMDLVMFETPNSEYSDYAVSESKTKEEMDDKELKLPIIGNFKNWTRGANEVSTSTPSVNTEIDKDDDLPF